MDVASSIYLENLAELVEDGTLSIEDRRMVRPILAAKIRMGLFENPYAGRSTAGQGRRTARNTGRARWAAHRSMVLLKNEGGLLPLSKVQRRRSP